MKWYQFIYIDLDNNKLKRHSVLAINKEDAQRKWNIHVAPYNRYNVLVCNEATIADVLNDND